MNWTKSLKPLICLTIFTLNACNALMVNDSSAQNIPSTSLVLSHNLLDYKASGTVDPQFQWRDTVRIADSSLSLHRIGGDSIQTQNVKITLKSSEIQSLNSLLATMDSTRDADSVISTAFLPLGGGSGLIQIVGMGTFYDMVGFVTSATTPNSNFQYHRFSVPLQNLDSAIYALLQAHNLQLQEIHP